MLPQIFAATVATTLPHRAPSLSSPSPIRRAFRGADRRPRDSNVTGPVNWLVRAVFSANDVARSSVISVDFGICIIGCFLFDYHCLEFVFLIGDSTDR
ncbi:hypothetical protein GWI33_017105 [Rhynchophorus ferrugineus]|uniref:Uncharacterized protein n=1 Tax=Rhynchophorus ferrugineus TaxID=354439 RepID=A0A834M7Z5_RHYFE|nr:hypothetical protein GWI33_017105 [Rhynchophorus ferrugineus]